MLQKEPEKEISKEPEKENLKELEKDIIKEPVNAETISKSQDIENIENIPKKEEDKTILKDTNNIKEMDKISPRVADKVTNEYIKHDKMPQSIEGWQELKHIFKKWKNLNNNKEDLITNPQYIAWFRRNCDNGNIPEISKKEKINDFLHIDIDDNDENSPTKINNYISRIKYRGIHMNLCHMMNGLVEIVKTLLYHIMILLFLQIENIFQNKKLKRLICP